MADPVAIPDDIGGPGVEDVDMGGEPADGGDPMAGEDNDLPGDVAEPVKRIGFVEYEQSTCDMMRKLLT